MKGGKMTEAELLKRLKAEGSLVGVVGMGYVGLPLAIEFVKAGFEIVGFDVDATKTTALNNGESYIKHISEESISGIRDTGRFSATTEFDRISDMMAIVICVPTPLTRHREPDMSYIVSTAETIAPRLRAGQLVTLESTTYPGTTDEVLRPILEKASSLKAGKDFFLAYSPEREDPNNPNYSTATIPKVVGADDSTSRKLAEALYDSIIGEVVSVSSSATAEATKLVENIFRSVNIAMVNELKVIFTKMGIDIWEVVNAAKTKPFGYMPFYPGPGLGGHCIPIDPFYLTWKAREFETSTKFIELAGEINTTMPAYVVQRTMEALNEEGLAVKGSKILLVGLAYKKNVDDLRESPTFKLWELFEEKGAAIEYYDPHCPAVPALREHPEFKGKKSVNPKTAGKFDAVVISTAHDDVDHAEIASLGKCVVDSRNALPNDFPNLTKA
jgi:UDP-N-acetyl-D-glucosamine dehydrogenase